MSPKEKYSLHYAITRSRSTAAARQLTPGAIKKVREKSRECHNHKPHHFPATNRNRKQTKPNKPKLNKHTKNTNVSPLFPKQSNRNAKRTENHKNKITQGKTLNKLPRRINYKQHGVRLLPGLPPYTGQWNKPTGRLKHFYG